MSILASSVNEVQGRGNARAKEPASVTNFCRGRDKSWGEAWSLLCGWQREVAGRFVLQGWIARRARVELRHWPLRAICEWQTGPRERSVESLRAARRLSAVYETRRSMAAAMVAAPEQVAVLCSILAASAADGASRPDRHAP